MSYLIGQARRGLLPECDLGVQCSDCPFAETEDCAIATDRDFLELLEYFSNERAIYEQHRERQLSSVKTVLSRHKVAMHWQLIATIARKSDPDLFPSDRSVLGLLSLNSKLFVEDAPGTYRLAGPSKA